MLCSFLVLAVSSFLQPSQAQKLGVAPEVSPEYVELTLLKNPDSICLFDTVNLVGNYKQLFHEEHIKGSQLFDLNRVTYETENEHKAVVHPNDFTNYVQSLGVDQSCHVVLYDHGEVLDSLKTAARAWWLFKLYGHERVSVMHGGLRQWKYWYHVVPLQSGNATHVRPRRGNFRSSWTSDMISSIGDVEYNFVTNNSILVDARPQQEFMAQIKDKLAVNKGRIKGSTNIPLSDVLLSHGILKSRESLYTIFIDKQIVSVLGRLLTEHPVMLYCNDGMDSSVVALALAVCEIPSSLFNGGWIQYSKEGKDIFMIRNI